MATPPRIKILTAAVTGHIAPFNIELGICIDISLSKMFYVIAINPLGPEPSKKAVLITVMR